MIFYIRKKMRKSLCLKERKVKMKKTFMRVAAVAVICAIAGSASGCYFFPEEEKLLDPPVLKVEDVTYSTYKAVKKTIVNKASATALETRSIPLCDTCPPIFLI